MGGQYPQEHAVSQGEDAVADVPFESVPVKRVARQADTVSRALDERSSYPVQ